MIMFGAKLIFLVSAVSLTSIWSTNSYSFEKPIKFYLSITEELCDSFSLQQMQPVVELDTAIVNNLIEATFNGYDCLNILIHKNNFTDHDETKIIKAIHSISNAMSVQLIESLENAIHYCGFLVISNDTEGLYNFIRVRYDDVIRLLYVDSAFPVDDDDILRLDTDEIRLHDMDLALVKLNVQKKVEKIFVKTRYENKTHLLQSDFSKPFFHHKNFIPKSVNYHRKIVRYMAFDCPLFSIIVNGELVGGIETLIYKEIERKLNYTAIGSVPDDDKRWGLAFPNRTITGGILKQLYERNVDIGFCAFWIDFSKLWVGTFSTYWEFECLQFLIPKPRLLPPHWKNILKPLPRTVWTLVLLGLIIVSSTCYILKYVEERKAMTRGDASIVTESLTIIGILLLSKNPEKNHGKSVNRHIFMWWSLFALLITTLYSSSLVSHLTYPQFEPMIETVDGLVKAGYYWGTDYPIMANRFMDMENPLHVAFMNSYKKEQNEAERISRLRDGNYSIFAKIVGQRHFMEVDKIPLEMLRDLRTSRECHFFFYVAFVLRKAFPLALINDQIIRQLLECGIIQYWLDRMFEPKYPLTTFKRVYEYKTPPEEIELTPLRVENLQGAFWIFVIGNQIACITFVGEILISKRKQKTS